MSVQITHVPEQRRFEARESGRPAGLVEYMRTDAGLIVYTHTEVKPEFEGKGVGSALVKSALDYARDNELAVLPLCPFIKSFIRRHREYADLVYRPKPSTASD